MINSGAITANSSENLLFYRIDTGNLKRKTNWIQAKYSIKLHWFFWKKMNFWNIFGRSTFNYNSLNGVFNAKSCI